MSCITEYNEELHLKTVREEGREEGRKEGREEGRKEGREEGRLIIRQAIDLFCNGFNTAEKLMSKGVEKEDAEFVVKTLSGK